MFRCYFIENGRISWGNDLKASTLAEAIERAQDLRQASLKSDKSPGIEIWQGASLLFQDVHDADQIQGCAPIISPFDTPESTIYATWRPSQARPLMGRPEVWPDLSLMQDEREPVDNRDAKNLPKAFG